MKNKNFHHETCKKKIKTISISSFISYKTLCSSNNKTNNKRSIRNSSTNTYGTN